MNRIPIVCPPFVHLDSYVPEAQGEARLRGWIFRPDVQIRSLDIRLDGKLWASNVPLQERPDVRAAYRATVKDETVDPGWSGFDLRRPLPEELRENATPIISFTPLFSDGVPLSPAHTYFHNIQEDLKHQPQPPKDLQDRIGGSENFLLDAGRLTNLLLDCITHHRPVWEPGDVLDWGCGCGRVIAQMMKLFSPTRLHGCDIDAEAIAWDQENLRGPHFRRIEPYPPTTYPDDSFDMIYGISVMTHLDEETQVRWLRELQRIARPGAILALSVIGEDLRRTRMPPDLAASYEQRGFATFVPDYSDSLAAQSHKEYYKESYHSLDYIAETWGEFFEILECVETKHQDIIILRAR